MRAGIERTARALWRGELGVAGALVSLALAPLAGVWRAVTWWRLRHSSPTTVPGARVISVGNLAVGGTGKTPLVSWLVSHLAGRGVPCAIVVSDRASDEAELHRRWHPAVPVHVARSRLAAVESARDEGARVVVADDAFQHVGLARDLDVILLALEDGLPSRVLPRGPFRESAASLDRADLLVITRRGADTLEDARTFAQALEARAAERGRARPVTACLHLAPGRLVDLGAWADGDDGSASPPAVRDPVCVSAIAKPRAFVGDVAALCAGATSEISFADHHAFTERDARRVRERAADRPIVITEKDAGKLLPFAEALGHTWVLLQEPRWDWGEAELFAAVDRVATLTDPREEAARPLGRP